MKERLARAWVLAVIALMARVPLAARERRGATVEVTMADGRQFKGELLAVKTDVLVVFDHGISQGWSLDARQVGQVRILRKSRALAGAQIGIGVGLALSIIKLRKIDCGPGIYVIEAARSFLPLPLMLFAGGMLGALASAPEKIPLDGEPMEKIRRNLKRVKRYAREQDPAD